MKSADLYVHSVANHDEGSSYGIKCTAFEEVTPVLDIIRKIIKKTGYNGFGCLNFKLLQSGSPITEDAWLEQQEEVNDASLDAVMYDFSALRLSDDEHWKATDMTPKIFEVNSRVCGSLPHHPTILAQWITAYLAS